MEKMRNLKSLCVNNKNKYSYLTSFIKLNNLIKFFFFILFKTIKNNFSKYIENNIILKE